MDSPALLAALLVFVGGWLAVDATSLGQLMVSRPLVAATLGGWLAGAPEQGALLGLVLEALQLSVLPIGAARYPEPGPAALLGGAAVAWQRGAGLAILPAVVLFCLVWEWISGLTVQWLRRCNDHYAVPADVAAVSGATLRRLHFGALALDFARGCIVTALGLAALQALRALAPALLLPPVVARPLTMLIAAAGVASVLRLFGARRAGWALCGGAAGLAFVLLAG